MHRSPLWHLPAALLLAAALPTGCSDTSSSTSIGIDQSQPAAPPAAALPHAQGEPAASDEPPLAANRAAFVKGPILFPPVADDNDESDLASSATAKVLQRLPRTGDTQSLRLTPDVPRDDVGFTPLPLPPAQPLRGECIVFEPTSADEATPTGDRSVWSHSHPASDLADVKSVLIGNPPPADATVSPVVGQQWATSDAQSPRRLPPISAD